MIEWRKMKRTGYFPAMLLGGLLAAAFPVVNMAVRGESFTALPGNPMEILMGANWPMMAMVNELLTICGCCILYHMEFADKAIQKMWVLPIHPGRIFLGKFVIALFALTVMVAVEMGALAGCSRYWFPQRPLELGVVGKAALFQVILTLPTVMGMLVIASGCQNMWVSLGIGVILVFALSLVPQDNGILSLLPFASPYQTYFSPSGSREMFLAVCLGEGAVFAGAELIFLKIRRCFV